MDLRSKVKVEVEVEDRHSDRSLTLIAHPENGECYTKITNREGDVLFEMSTNSKAPASDHLPANEETIEMLERIESGLETSMRMGLATRVILGLVIEHLRSEIKETD